MQLKMDEVKYTELLMRIIFWGLMSCKQWNKRKSNSDCGKGTSPTKRDLGGAIGIKYRGRGQYFNRRVSIETQLTKQLLFCDTNLMGGTSSTVVLYHMLAISLGCQDRVIWPRWIPFLVISSWKKYSSVNQQQFSNQRMR